MASGTDIIARGMAGSALNTLPFKADLVDGKVPASELPSYVDDVVEVNTYAELPIPGERSKIYITIDDNKTYRWSGSVYVMIADGKEAFYMCEYGVTTFVEVSAALADTRLPMCYYNNVLYKYASLKTDGTISTIYLVSITLDEEAYVAINSNDVWANGAKVFQEQLTAGNGIALTSDSTISVNRNAYNHITQIADYLFDVQYSTENIDYAYANNYFQNVTAAELDGAFGACTAVVKDSRVLRQFDYYYDNNAEFIVRRQADPEHNVYGSVGIATGITGLTKDVVESGQYHVKYKLVPFDTCDGINDQGLYIQQNVVPMNDIVYDINPTSSVECCVTMLLRYMLDYCATFADVESALNNLHIYSTNAIKYGFHFMVAKGSAWEVIELTADGHVTVTEGTGTNQMPHGIMTNFRTSGLTFTDSAVDWASIEQFGLGVERYDIATTAFTGSVTLESLRSELKYTRLYTDTPQTWKTELSGEPGGSGTGGKLTVMDATDPTYNAVYTSLFATEKANYDDRTRADGKGTWQTTHSAIYDLTNKSFSVAIQERFGTTYNVQLINDVDLVSGLSIKTVNSNSVLGSGNIITAEQEDVHYTNANGTTVTVGGIAKGTTFNNKSLKDLLEDMLYPYVAFIFNSISTSAAAKTYEYGTSVTVATVTPSFTLGSKSINDVQIGSASGAHDLYSGTSATSGAAITLTTPKVLDGLADAYIYCSLGDGVNMVEKSAKFTFAKYNYYTVTSSTAIPTTGTNNGTSTVVNSITTGEGTYIWFLVPTTKTKIQQFAMNQWNDMATTYAGSFTFTTDPGQQLTYHAYRTDMMVTATGKYQII